MRTCIRVLAMGLFLSGCGAPGLGPTNPGTSSPAPDDPDTPAPTGPPVALEFTYSGASLVATPRIPRSAVLNGGVASQLDIAVTPLSADLNVEEIRNTFQFLWAGGSDSATYDGQVVATTDFSVPTDHGTKHARFSLAPNHLRIGTSDLFGLAPWTKYTKLRVTTGVSYFSSPGVPTVQSVSVKDFLLVQDLPALEGFGYLAFFNVTANVDPAQFDPPPLAKSQWRVTAWVNYPDHTSVTGTPRNLGSGDSALFLMNGLRPTGPGLAQERWTVGLDVYGTGSLAVTWPIPDFSVSGSGASPIIECFFDDSGLPVVDLIP